MNKDKWIDWVDDFYDEPIIKGIVHEIGLPEYFGAVRAALEICHGLQSYFSRYGSMHQDMRALTALLRKYDYADATVCQWVENPYAKKVYDFLEKEAYGQGRADSADSADSADNMTWEDLAAAIAAMPPERRKDNVSVFVKGEDEFYPVTRIQVSSPANDVLDEGCRYMVTP